jgi:hypothetical protein
MRQISISFFIFISSWCSAQKDSSSNCISFRFAEYFSHRILRAEDKISQSYFDELESGRMSNQFGIYGVHNLRQNLGFVIGLNYTKFQYQIDSLPELSMSNIRYRYNYLQLPLGLQLSKKKSALTYWTELTLDPGYLILSKWSYRLFESTKDNQLENDMPLNKIKVGTSLCFGISKRIHQNYTFQIGTHLSTSFTPISSNELTRTLYSLGLMVGISKHS